MFNFVALVVKPLFIIVLPVESTAEIEAAHSREEDDKIPANFFNAECFFEFIG